jgi:YggT family protein
VHPIGQVIQLVLWLFILLLFARLVVDWIQVFARSWTPKGPVLVLLEGVYTATDPPIKAFRKVFEPIRIGGMALDLSFLVVLLICYLLLAVNQAIWT